MTHGSPASTSRRSSCTSATRDQHRRPRRGSGDCDGSSPGARTRARSSARRWIGCARYRLASFGTKTAKAIDRYLRVSRGHEAADSPALWLGLRGPMTASGVRQMLWRRSASLARGTRGARPRPRGRAGGRHARGRSRYSHREGCARALKHMTGRAAGVVGSVESPAEAGSDHPVPLAPSPTLRAQGCRPTITAYVNAAGTRAHGHGVDRWAWPAMGGRHSARRSARGQSAAGGRANHGGREFATTVLACMDVCHGCPVRRPCLRSAVAETMFTPRAYGAAPRARTSCSPAVRCWPRSALRCSRSGCTASTRWRWRRSPIGSKRRSRIATERNRGHHRDGRITPVGIHLRRYLDDGCRGDPADFGRAEGQR